MRTLLVAEQLRRPVPGGIGTYIRGVAQGLHALAGDDRPDVSVYATRPAAGFDAVAALGFPVVASPVQRHALTRLWDRGLGRTPRGYDVVHGTSLAFPPPGTPARLAVTVHDLVFRETPDAFPPRGRRWHEAALQRALRTADAIVAPSERTAAALHAAGAKEKQVHVVHEGCDHLAAADHDAATAVLRAHGVDGPFLMTVSTLEPRKNLRRLVEAYALARPRLPDPWPLVVVGPAGWGDGGPPPTRGVVPLGFVDDAVLSALYASARCTAYVPLAEGFGLPAVEAMHSACPVVASPMPSTGGAGLTVDPTDPRAIADALVAAAADDRVRSELVTSGLLRAGELTWEAAARGHVAVWESLL